MDTPPSSLETDGGTVPPFSSAGNTVTSPSPTGGTTYLSKYKLPRFPFLPKPSGFRYPKGLKRSFSFPGTVDVGLEIEEGQEEVYYDNAYDSTVGSPTISAFHHGQGNAAPMAIGSFNSSVLSNTPSLVFSVPENQISGNTDLTQPDLDVAVNLDAPGHHVFGSTLPEGLLTQNHGFATQPAFPPMAALQSDPFSSEETGNPFSHHGGNLDTEGLVNLFTQGTEFMECQLKKNGQIMHNIKRRIHKTEEHIKKIRTELDIDKKDCFPLRWEARSRSRYQDIDNLLEQIAADWEHIRFHNRQAERIIVQALCYSGSRPVSEVEMPLSHGVCHGAGTALLDPTLLPGDASHRATGPETLPTLVPEWFAIFDDYNFVCLSEVASERHRYRELLAIMDKLRDIIDNAGNGSLDQFWHDPAPGWSTSKRRLNGG